MPTWIKSHGQVLDLNNQDNRNVVDRIEKLWERAILCRRLGQMQLISELSFLPGIVFMDIGSRRF